MTRVLCFGLARYGEIDALSIPPPKYGLHVQQSRLGGILLGA